MVHEKKRSTWRRQSWTTTDDSSDACPDTTPGSINGDAMSRESSVETMQRRQRGAAAFPLLCHGDPNPLEALEDYACRNPLRHQQAITSLSSFDITDGESELDFSDYSTWLEFVLDDGRIGGALAAVLAGLDAGSNRNGRRPNPGRKLTTEAPDLIALIAEYAVMEEETEEITFWTTWRDCYDYKLHPYRWLKFRR